MTSRTRPSTPWSPPLRIAIAAALALAVAAPLQANDPYKKEAKTSAATGMKSPSGTTVAADRAFLGRAIKGSEKEVAATMLARERASDAKVRELAANLQRDHLNLLSQLDETAVALGVRDTRTYGAIASSSTPSAERTDTDVASSDKTASSGYVDDVSASGSTTLGGSKISAPGTAAPAPGASAGTKMKESADVNTPGVAAAKQDPAVQALAREAGPEFDRAFLDAMISSHEKTVAAFTEAAADMKLSAQSRSLAEQSLPTLRDHLEMTRSLRSSLATN